MSDIEDGHGAIWSGPVVSRRTAIGYTGVLASAAVLTGCNFDSLQPAIGSPEPTTGDDPHTFSFVHDETVRVIVSPNVDPSKFDLTIRAEGQELEVFRGLNGRTVETISSNYLTVRFVPVPGGVRTRQARGR